jgi:hypothetical protein
MTVTDNGTGVAEQNFKAAGSHAENHHPLKEVGVEISAFDGKKEQTQKRGLHNA